MTTLTKKQVAERDACLAKLNDKYDKLRQAVISFNSQMEADWRDTIEKNLKDYNEEVQVANAWRETVEGLIGDAYNAKSEKWQESEKGVSVAEWKSSFGEEFDELELEMPEFVNIEEDSEVVNLLENLEEGYE